MTEGKVWRGTEFAPEDVEHILRVDESNLFVVPGYWKPCDESSIHKLDLAIKRVVWKSVGFVEG